MMRKETGPYKNNRGDKNYSLRPRSLNKNNDSDDEGDTKKSKKPAPLSKYRRKTANARERQRMNEMNKAFKRLRQSIPIISGVDEIGNEKMTKITTLKLAMGYIEYLGQQLVDSYSDESEITGDLSVSDDDRSLTSFSDSSSRENHSDIPMDFTEFSTRFSAFDQDVLSFLIDSDTE